METLVLGGALLGSLAGAFLIQKVALEGLFRIMGRPPDKTLITSGSRVRGSSAWTGGFWSSSASAC